MWPRSARSRPRRIGRGRARCGQQAHRSADREGRDLKTNQNLQTKLDELAKLDDTSDPTGEKDPITGKDITNKALFNTRTERFVNAPGSKAAQKLPPGMVKQVGTAGGRPVYKDAQGKRFREWPRP